MISGYQGYVGALALIWLLPVTAMAQMTEAEIVAEDCRLEGEGVGLTGAQLDDFVRECIVALLEEVDLSTTSKPLPAD